MEKGGSKQSLLKLQVTENQHEDKNYNVVSKRLSVIRLAERLGNISEACRRSGINRTSFYQWRRRFINYGVEGLKDKPPVHKRHPNTTPKIVIEELLVISLKHPEWGCVRIAERLKQEGTSISSPTVQKILARHGMGTRRERMAPEYEGFDKLKVRSD